MARNFTGDTRMEQIVGEIRDNIRVISNGFQRLDKIKDMTRKAKQLDQLTEQMKGCKRLIKEFDTEIKEAECRIDPSAVKELNSEKQSMIKELNSYVELRKVLLSNLETKKVEVMDMGEGASGPAYEDNVKVVSEKMSNQELVIRGTKIMTETDQVIERSTKVVAQTIEVGSETAAKLHGQTEQMGRIVDDLETVHFSINKASRLVKRIARQVATDRCIMFFLFLIVCGVVAVIIVKIVDPHNKSVKDIPGLAPPAQARRLLATWNADGV